MRASWSWTGLGRGAVAAFALTLAACGASQDALGPSGGMSLIGPTWQLVSLEGRAAVAGSRVTAVFAEGDRVSGSAGCNSYFGRARAADGRLAVRGLGSTLMYCTAEGVMPQEQAYLAALERAAVFGIAGTELRVGPAPGVVTLVFRAE
jgi:heat shock protein HslJ